MFRLRSATHEGIARMPACVFLHFTQISEIKEVLRMFRVIMRRRRVQRL